MIIDAHGHWGYVYHPHCGPLAAEQYVEAMDRHGIDRSIIAHARGLWGDFRVANAELDVVLRAFPRRLFGYVTVNPNYLRDSLDQLDRYAGQGNWIGAKLHPAYHRAPIDGRLNDRLFAACAEKRLPVLCHSIDMSLDEPGNWQAPERIVAVSNRYPEIPAILLGHMGGNHARGVAVAERTRNVMLEVCTSFPRYGALRDAVQRVGAERLIYGSDFPALDPQVIIGWVQDDLQAEEERAAVFHRNAERIFFQGMAALT